MRMIREEIEDIRKQIGSALHIVEAAVHRTNRNTERAGQRYLVLQ
jgi:hypothetical protein